MFNSLHPIEKLVEENKHLLLPIHAELLENKDPEFMIITQNIINLLNLSPQTDETKAKSLKFIWKPHQQKQDFHSFLKIVSKWAMIHKFQNSATAQKQSECLNYLNNLLGYYKSLGNKSSQLDLEQIKLVVEQIKSRISQVSVQYFTGNIRISFRTEVLEIEIQSLKEIFKFFAVQHLFLGRAPTFQMIQEQTELMDCGTFLAFCKQFSLFTDEKRQKMTQRGTLTQIFKKHATLNSHMTFSQFFEAIEAVALIYFNEENDVMGLKVFGYEENERKILFFEKIRVADVRLNRKRMRPLSQNSLRRAGHSGYEPEVSVAKVLDKDVDRGRIVHISNSFIRRNSSQIKLEKLAKAKSASRRQGAKNRVSFNTQRQLSAAKPRIKTNIFIHRS